jgi:alkylhydroperoxidase family enzyme
VSPARLAPLPKERWDDAVREALRRGFPEAAPRFLASGPDAAPVPNVLGTLLHHPLLAGPFLAYNRVLLQTPALGHRLRELIVLRVAWRTRSLYEWVQHVRIAASLMTTEEIRAIARADGDGAWTPLERALLAATDQLVDRHRIDDVTWAALAAQLDGRQLVELVFTAGTYTCLAMAFNSFGLELDAGLELPAGIPLPPSDSEPGEVVHSVGRSSR